MQKNFLLSPITVRESYLEGHVISLSLFAVIAKALNCILFADLISSRDQMWTTRNCLFSSIVREREAKHKRAGKLACFAINAGKKKVLQAKF